jgi:tRNA G18 (ribose-2'-O)-methylase SpoU
MGRNEILTNSPLFRNETRKKRYQSKMAGAKSYPISVCCVNFMHDGNLGYLIRSSACFGAKDIHVIGSVPKRSDLKSLSGGLCDYVKIIQHNSPSDFLSYARNTKAQIISAEIDETATPITAYHINFDSNIILVVGNEQTGIPVEILSCSDKICIPMPGVGFCLNTSQTANILLYEFVNRIEQKS